MKTERSVGHRRTDYTGNHAVDREQGDDDASDEDGAETGPAPEGTAGDAAPEERKTATTATPPIAPAGRPW